MLRWLAVLALLSGQAHAAAIDPFGMSASFATGTTTAPTVNNVVITGSPVQGQTATVSPTITGLPSPAVTYQWFSNGTAVGTNSPNYTSQAGDLGNGLTVTVTAVNSAGSASVTSPTFGPVFTLTAISLSSTTTTGASGAQVGCVTVTTNPVNQPWAGPVTISGTDAANYVMTNGGGNPTCLNVGATTINGGQATSNSISLTVTK